MVNEKKNDMTPNKKSIQPKGSLMWITLYLPVKDIKKHVLCQNKE